MKSHVDVKSIREMKIYSHEGVIKYKPLMI